MSGLSLGERDELAGSVRAVCERFCTQDRVREVAYNRTGRLAGYDQELWQVLCSQIGIAAIALPEHLGGAGYGADALGVVAHELGRVLAPVPLVASTVLATGLLVRFGGSDPDVQARIDGLLDGRRTAAAAITGDGGRWDRTAGLDLPRRRVRHPGPGRAGDGRRDAGEPRAGRADGRRGCESRLGGDSVAGRALARSRSHE